MRKYYGIRLATLDIIYIGEFSSGIEAIEATEDIKGEKPYIDWVIDQKGLAEFVSNIIATVGESNK